jgi:hypothetical protein
VPFAFRPFTAASLLGAAALLATLPAGAEPDASPAPLPPLATLLERYDRAMVDPGAPRAHYLERGGIAGSGTWGDFTHWVDGDRSREDDTFGPGTQRQYRKGEREYLVDANGIVRELRGSLLRRARTEQLIDDARLSAAHDCCVLKGRTSIDGRPAFEVVVNAKGGEPESLYLDGESGYPLRLEYEEADGTTTVDFSDWHSFGGRRFAFRRIESSGDHEYDIRQTTETVETAAVFGDDVFDVPATRLVEADGVQELAFESSRGDITVPVEIGGKTFHFLLDSGSQDIVLDRRVAKALALHEQGDLQVLGTARAGGVAIARLPELKVGGATMRDLVVNTLDLAKLTAGAIKADGILGYPFFGEALVEIDIRHARMRFGRPGAFVIAGESVPVELDRSLPEVPMEANAVSGNFLIDTGNSADLLIFRTFLDRHPGMLSNSFTIRSSVGVGGFAKTYHTTLALLRVGSFHLTGVSTDVILSTTGAFADRFLAGDAGAGVLKEFVVTFDFPDDALYLARR